MESLMALGNRGPIGSAGMRTIAGRDGSLLRVSVEVEWTNCYHFLLPDCMGQDKNRGGR